MFSRILPLFLVLFMVVACETPPTDGGSAGGSGEVGAGSGKNGNIVPGSQEDLNASAGDRVFFAYDSSTLDDAAQATLTRQAEWLKKYPNAKVQIEGHCDERGTREYNLALGERRAAAVKKFLVRSGVAASKVSTISYGKERPAVTGSDESSWSQNRRGVTVVQ